MSSRRARKRAKKATRRFFAVSSEPSTAPIKPERIVGSISERIVRFFEDEAVGEAHINTVCERLRITREQFRQNIGAARDLRVKDDFRLVAMYERDGWWTCRPTVRIMAVYEHESAKRNTSEQQRNHRVFRGSKLEPLAASVAMSALGSEEAVWNKLAPELATDASFDWIIAGVDEAIEQGRGFVAREQRVAA